MGFFTGISGTITNTAGASPSTTIAPPQSGACNIVWDQPEHCAETHSLVVARGGVENKTFAIDKCTRAYSGSFRVLFIDPANIQSVVNSLISTYTQSVPQGYYLIIDETVADTGGNGTHIETTLLTGTRNMTVCEADVAAARLPCGAYDVTVHINRTRETYTQYTPPTNSQG